MRQIQRKESTGDDLGITEDEGGERYFIMPKDAAHSEDIKVINVCVPSKPSTVFIKLKL